MVNPNTVTMMLVSGLVPVSGSLDCTPILATPVAVIIDVADQDKGNKSDEPIPVTPGVGSLF